MPQRSAVRLEPRKLPVQARSNASVDAILDATIQVLLALGKKHLTTTKVALRAGVSVGTLYQYFPNKSALLQATLKRHLSRVTQAVENVCRDQTAKPIREMGSALVTAFLDAKLSGLSESVAMYAVSSDVEGAKIAQQSSIQSIKAIAGMLATAPEPLIKDPELVASMLQSTMAGVSRRLLESTAPEKQLDTIREELIFFVSSYLEASAAK